MLRTERGRDQMNGDAGHDGSQKGVLDRRKLPDSGFDALWDAIILDQQLKDRLLSQAVLNFTVRPRLDESTLPLHGVILLVGPPGTGKTSLARALASRTASTVRGLGTFQYLEVEPHALASSSLGKSQQAVRHLLGTTVAEAASQGPLIVVLDEVETLAADRTRMSLEAMALQLLRPPFKTDYPLEFMSFFATAQRRIHETWADPAGLGPPVSDSMDSNARTAAEAAFKKAQYTIREAINLGEKGQNGEALRVYRRLFGEDHFPLS